MNRYLAISLYIILDKKLYIKRYHLGPTISLLTVVIPI